MKPEDVGELVAIFKKIAPGKEIHPSYFNHSGQTFTKEAIKNIEKHLYGYKLPEIPLNDEIQKVMIQATNTNHQVEVINQELKETIPENIQAIYEEVEKRLETVLSQAEAFNSEDKERISKLISLNEDLNNETIGQLIETIDYISGYHRFTSKHGTTNEYSDNILTDLAEVNSKLKPNGSLIDTKNGNRLNPEKINELTEVLQDLFW